MYPQGMKFLARSALAVCLACTAGGCGEFGGEKIAADFGLHVLTASTDYNSNGVDDYTDFLLGARADAENNPRYDGAYVVGGYPAEDVGVCADVVWRAFRAAGYSLKDMIDADIAAHPEDYPRASKPDPNIDFRRVKNLHVFFAKYGQELTTDVSRIGEWMPGDIVLFAGPDHIGIVSEKRASDGTPYLIHNGGQKKREENFLGSPLAAFDSSYRPIGHYRFDAAQIAPDVLRPWRAN